jgi:hypothetical protein
MKRQRGGVRESLCRRCRWIRGGGGESCLSIALLLLLLLLLLKKPRQKKKEKERKNKEKKKWEKKGLWPRLKEEKFLRVQWRV